MLPLWNLRTAMLRIASLALVMSALIAMERAPGFQGSNCGGNAAALNDVKYYSLIVQTAAVVSPDHSFSMASATAQECEWLSQIVGDAWIRPARFFVSPRPSRYDPSGPRKLLMLDELLAASKP